MAKDLLKPGSEVCWWNSWLGKHHLVPMGKAELWANGDRTAATTFCVQLIAHIFCSCIFLFVDAHFSASTSYYYDSWYKRFAVISWRHAVLCESLRENPVRWEDGKKTQSQRANCDCRNTAHNLPTSIPVSFIFFPTKVLTYQQITLSKQRDFLIAKLFPNESFRAAGTQAEAVSGRSGEGRCTITTERKPNAWQKEHETNRMPHHCVSSLI